MLDPIQFMSLGTVIVVWFVVYFLVTRTSILSVFPPLGRVFLCGGVLVYLIAPFGGFVWVNTSVMSEVRDDGSDL